MRLSKVLLNCIIGLAFSSTASAEIYQSKDAQGNTVFSDIPSQGAEAVKLPTTNSAEPVVATPRPADAAEPPAPRKVSAKPTKPVKRAQDMDDNYDDDYYYGNGSNDNDAQPNRDRPVKVQPLPSGPRRAAGGGGRR